MPDKFKRVHVVVMDSVGIGEAPDAAKFGDFDVDTFGHIAKHVGGLKMPEMGKLGLSNIREIDGIKKQKNHLLTIQKCKKLQMVKIQ